MMTMPKKSKKLLKLCTLAVIVLASMVSVGLHFSGTSPSLALAQIVDGRPMSIIIPRAHVQTTIEGVAQALDGSLDKTKLATNVGWYKSGAKPGETGSAVLVGSVNWKYGHTSVFSDLHFLEPGDVITVRDDGGEDKSFVVQGSKSYELDEDYSPSLGSNDGQSHLVLVTTDGSWDKSSKSYSKRLVVTADKATTTIVSILP